MAGAGIRGIWRGGRPIASFGIFAMLWLALPSQAAGVSATPAVPGVYRSTIPAGRPVTLPPRTKEAPKLSPGQQAALEKAAARMNRHRGRAGQVGSSPVGPRALSAPSSAPPAPAARPLSSPSAFAPYPGPNDLYAFRDTTLANVTPNPTPSGSQNPSEVAEPSVSNNGSEVFYTGNWFDAVSNDSGASWTYNNPYTAPAPPSGQTFCCDQSTIYDPSRDITIWELLYLPQTDTGDNVLRLAVASGKAGVVNGVWHSFDFAPANLTTGVPPSPIFPAGSWFDYPQLGLSATYLYVSANIFKGSAADPSCFQSTTACIQQGSVMLRMPLDGLASTGTLGFDYYREPCSQSSCMDTFTPVSKAGATMYWAAHAGTFQTASPTDLRVYSWPDANLNVTFHDVADFSFNYMYGADGVCPINGASSINPCARDDSRIRAGWLVGSQLGFVWDARQDAPTYPYPYLRGAVVSTVNWTVTADPVIAYTDTAATYGYVARNAAGHLGISLTVMGGPYHPSAQIGVQDDLSPPGDWSFFWLKIGSGNPTGSRWGDYLAVRPASGTGDTWVATGYTVENGSVKPLFGWFGRVRDDPFVAQNVTCGAGMTGSMGAQLPSQTLATFTPTTNRLADYRATIDWGDGTTSAASIGGTPSAGTVSGSHAFASAGTLTVTVTVIDPIIGTASCNLTATITGSVYTTSSEEQYVLQGSDGTTWKDIDAGKLSLAVTATAASNAVISGNADLFVDNPGVNQDLGIAVDGTVVAWKESGGFAGTFSPNAAFVQSAVPMAAGPHTVRLVWKMNQSSLVRIYAGAGPNGPSYSPTRLTVQLIPSASPNFGSRTIKNQLSLSNSDGATWRPVSSALDISFPTTSSGRLVIGGNADLWTATAGYNQDIGIKVDGTVIAWKESGGSNGTFSPNAAFVQGVAPVSAGTHAIQLVWKVNRNAPGVTIYAGAGPSGTNFSPTSLTVAFMAAAGVLDAVGTTQYATHGDDGRTWWPMDPQSLTVTIPANATANCVAIIGANADLWTANGGFNQDLAIAVDNTINAWKESGGFAGTFSPNAALAQTVIAVPAGSSLQLDLRWKMNTAAPPSVTIHAGAGPINGQFSPTRLTAQLVCS